MNTYLILNIIFLLIVCLVFRIRIHRPTKQKIIVFAVLFLLTLIFDSMLVYFHIIAYDTRYIAGIFIGLAPFEDYFYPLLAVLLIPVLWQRFGDTNNE